MKTAKTIAAAIDYLATRYNDCEILSVIEIAETERYIEYRATLARKSGEGLIVAHVRANESDAWNTAARFSGPLPGWTMCDTSV